MSVYGCQKAQLFSTCTPTYFDIVIPYYNLPNLSCHLSLLRQLVSGNGVVESFPGLLLLVLVLGGDLLYQLNGFVHTGKGEG